MSINQRVEAVALFDAFRRRFVWAFVRTKAFWEKTGAGLAQACTSMLAPLRPAACAGVSQ